MLQEKEQKIYNSDSIFQLLPHVGNKTSPPITPRTGREMKVYMIY